MQVISCPCIICFSSLPDSFLLSAGLCPQQVCCCHCPMGRLSSCLLQPVPLRLSAWFSRKTRQKCCLAPPPPPPSAHPLTPLPLGCCSCIPLTALLFSRSPVTSVLLSQRPVSALICSPGHYCSLFLVFHDRSLVFLTPQGCCFCCWFLSAPLAAGAAEDSVSAQTASPSH